LIYNHPLLVKVRPFSGLIAVASAHVKGRSYFPEGETPSQKPDLIPSRVINLKSEIE
jgi:hypothetical protein